MMDTMVRFSTSMLQGIAAFLGTEPVIYLFAIVCLTAIIKVFRALMP